MGCRIEPLEARLLLVIPGVRPAPDPLDEAILFRLPLSSDTTTHFYFDRNGSAPGDIAWNGTGQSYDGHTGSDFSGGPRGRPIYAAADGIITARVDGFGDQQGTANGNYIRLNHGNDRAGNPIVTWYLHMNAGTPINLPLGTFIAAGTEIGGVGTSGNSTGLHLHFHHTYDGAALDPYAASGETSWWVNQGSGSPSTTTPAKKFNIGDLVEVFALSGGTLTVRAPDPTSSQIGTQADGALGVVIAGPSLSYTGGDYTNQVYMRWKVRFNGGMEGWVAQNWLKKSPAAEINVAQGATTITDGQAGAYDFGAVQQGFTGPSRVFTVTNSGNQNLTLGTPSVPAGYTLVEGLSASLTPGASDTFTVRLDSATMGTKSGQISFSNNDPDENPFNFPITGVVTGDVTRPTADVIDITPDPLAGPLGSATIVFSEAVTDFGIDDLRLNRNAGFITLTAAQTLTTSDNITWTVNNLSPLTQASGSYALFVISTDVYDLAGNQLLATANDAFKIQTNLFRGDATGSVNDAYTLRRSTNGTNVEIFENASPGGTPTYTLPWATLSSLTFDAGGGNNTLTIDYTRGDPVPAGAGNFSYLAASGTNALNLTGTGTLTLHGDLGAGASNVSLSVGSSMVVLSAVQQLANVTVGAGKLDVRDQELTIAGGTYAGIGQMVASGCAGGTWNGSGIITSMTAAQSPAMRTTLGVSSAPGGVKVKYTLAGDANLDDAINGDDYFAIDAGHGGAGGGYASGDFDHSGNIDADDYFLIDSNYNNAPPPPGSAMPAGAELPSAAFAKAKSGNLIDELL